MIGAIYFFRVAPRGLIKIGWSTKVDKRLATTQVYCPYPVEMIGYLSNRPQSDEKHIHAMFSSDHVRGEWFKPSSELLEFIELHASDKEEMTFSEPNKDGSVTVRCWLTRRATKRIERLSDLWGISQSSVLELLIRKKAK